eukprot:scaffold29929_cov19-Tisochrysis_lutea.AAC.2
MAGHALRLGKQQAAMSALGPRCHRHGQQLSGSGRRRKKSSSRLRNHTPMIGQGQRSKTKEQNTRRSKTQTTRCSLPPPLLKQHRHDTHTRP